MTDIDVWGPHGSTFDALLFLIYKNDLSGDLLHAKQFEADTSLFSVVYNLNTSADEVNNDLVKFHKWAYNVKWVSILIQLNRLKNEDLLEK